MTTTDHQPAVSVIVAVYKAEAYLKRCVDSLLAQTFRDFEILLIDDGSPDRSGEMCDEYARQDSRVRVFHKENGGVSSARQCGLDNARGEYVIHADPDDWVEPEMLEEMYRKAKEEDADMVICDYYIEEKGETKYVIQRPSALDSETVMRELFQQLHGSCWNKLVRRVCYSQYQIQFPLELSYCEDVFVNACLLSHGIKVGYLPKAFYHYDQDVNPNSLVCRPVNIILEQEQRLHQLFKERVFPESFLYIDLYLKKRMFPKALNAGGIYLRDFRKEYAVVISNIRLFHFSFKKKIFYLFAFYISPYLAHLAYVVRNEVWNRFLL